MTKLFKNSKQILAFVFAFAILAVSLFTGSISITADACDVNKIDYWDGTKANAFESGDGSEADPYIIKTAEQLAYCCFGQSTADSTGKFYKVDDSVKIFVMQPESVVDLDTLISLDNAEEVKDYLTGLSGKKDWMSQYASNGFNGNFDGNGVTIYGLFADGIATNKSDVGLFPRYDGGYYDGAGNVVANVCKNVAVKNSYFSSTRRIGVISGASYGLAYDGEINGIIHYDTIAVVNCYIVANANNENHYDEEAIIADGGAGDVSTLNNCLVKGNYAYNTALGKEMAILAVGSNVALKDSNGELVENKLSNSVILGSDPFRRQQYSNLVFQNKKVDGATVRTFFENVITDQAAGRVTATNPSGWGSATSTAEFAEDMVKQITATGFDFQAAAATLDWENTWLMSENGPELREFHDGLVLETTTTTHVWKCEDCGLTSPGGVAEHNFALVGDEVIGDGTDVYICTICNYTCQHNELFDAVQDPGDCVTAPSTYIKCKFCDWHIVTDLGTIPGHNLEYVAACPGNCATEGNVEYWYCDVCENKFDLNDAMAAMDSAVTDAQLSTGLGGHVAAEDNNGLITLYDENGHWYICSIDGGRLDSNSNLLDDSAVIKHNTTNAIAFGSKGHTLYCPTCGYDSDGILPHMFAYGICKTCSWECKNHNYTGDTVVQSITCTKDEITEKTCTVCGIVNQVVTKKATGHNIVSTGNLNKCINCGYQYSKSDDVTNYPLNGKYDADYVEATTADVSYESVDFSKKTKIDRFTDFDVNFCINPETEGNGTASTPYIIKTANQFAAVVTGNLKDANGNWMDTEGIAFKIADDVYGFNLNNTGSSVDFSKDDLTAEKVEAALKGAEVPADLVWENKSGKPFKGNFDGNGACVYGLKGTATYSAIFPKIGGNITVKNLTVKNCYFTGSNVSAFFGANTNGNPGTGVVNTKHFMYNCQAYGNVLVCTFSTDEAIQRCGVLIGRTEYPTESILVVTDCLVYDNIAKHDTRSITYGIVGNLHRSGSLTINSSIIMDSAPHALYYGSNAHLSSSYHDLYTNMMGTQWENIDVKRNGDSLRYVYDYVVNDNVPTVGFNLYDKNGSNLINGGNGFQRLLSNSFVYLSTADDIVSSKSLDGISSEKWTYNKNGYPTPKVYKVREYSAGTNWSGEKAVRFGDGDGTSSAPFTVATAEELVLMLTQPVTGAYYKLVADIAINDTTASNWTDNAKTWFTSNDVPVFEASLDGNGYTVSGIYYDGKQAGESVGLIPVVGNTAEIRNITVTDSVINADKGVAGAITGSVADRCSKVVRFNAVTVKDTVVFNGKATFGGIIGKVGYSVVLMNDCISETHGLFNSVAGEAKVKRSVSIGAYPFANADSVRAEDVYTDIDGTVEGVTVIPNDVMLGEAAASSMPGLNFPTSWAVTDGYPTPTGVAASAEGIVGEPWTGAVATGFARGTGTEEDPYIIETPEQLAYFITKVKRSDGNFKYYQLGADIYLNDIKSKLWAEKIGCVDWYDQYVNYNQHSYLDFNGDGYVIYGLYMDTTTSTGPYVRAGLFPLMGQYSTIRNVGLSNVFMNGRNSDQNYRDVMGAFVGCIEDFDKFLGLDSHDATGNKEKLTNPENGYENMAVKLQNCFVDHNSYISAYCTGGFFGEPYSAPILENCIFTGSIGGNEDPYYTGVFTGCDSTYGTQLRGCVSLPQTRNCYVVGGSNGSSWRNKREYWVTTADPVYYIGEKTYGGDFTQIGKFTGVAAKDVMTRLDWADNSDDGTDDIWRAIAGRTPMLTVFEKHHSDEELLKFTYSFDTYTIENATDVGDYAFKGDVALKSITIADGVTEIGDYAFAYCASLESITIPDSVTRIGAHAFSGCTSLKNITLPNGITVIRENTFDGCTSLENIIIPYGVTTIAQYAFSYCESLLNVTIPASVSAIDWYAFDHCNSLAEINVDMQNSNYCSISGVLFNKDVTELIKYPAMKTDTQYTIPDTVTTVDYMAFYGCESLLEITIPDSVEMIDSMAFYGTGYYNNEDNWQDNALYIGDYLIEVKREVSGHYAIKDGTKRIAWGAVNNCNMLECITIPSSVVIIPDKNYAINLREIIVDENNSRYSSIDGVLYNKDATILIDCPMGIDVSEFFVPDSVKTINNTAFWNCYNLYSIYVGSNVETIGDEAFEGCNQLCKVIISDNVTYIGNQAFYGCSSLAEVTYTGNQTEWQDIIIGAGNRNLLNVSISFTGCEHHWQSHVIVEGNCTTDGVIAQECTWCDKTKTVIIEAGHTYGDVIVIEPTYQMDGYSIHTCTVCSYEEKFDIIPALTYIDGDVNGDVNINNKDLGLLMQYLNGWNVEIIVDAADVNSDDAVNNKDYGLLMQYANGWDVELG